MCSLTYEFLFLDKPYSKCDKIAQIVQKRVRKITTHYIISPRC